MTVWIDGLQYANWSEKIFAQMREGGVDAVHVTIAYHENFRETVLNIEAWNRRFEQHPDLIFHGLTGDDVRLARETNRTAIFFGFQNPSPIEDDIGLVEITHTLGARFMQLTYNNQSLLATGCYEVEDPGITRMGRQVIREMNRVGLVIDMSHSADRSTIEAADHSERPIAITHANPHRWQPALRNKRDSSIAVMAKLAADKKVDAVISAGNTGAVVASATINLGMLESVERPAIGIVIPLTAAWAAQRASALAPVHPA